MKKILFIINLTILTLLFSGCEEYENHKQMKQEKQVQEKMFFEANTRKKIYISTKNTINLETDNPAFYNVFSGKNIKLVSSEKVLEEYIIKITVDKNQFNISGNKTEEMVITILGNEEENKFILNALKQK